MRFMTNSHGEIREESLLNSGACQNGRPPKYQMNFGMNVENMKPRRDKIGRNVLWDYLTSF